MQPFHRFFDCPALPELAPAHRMAWYEWGNASNEHVLVCVHGLTRQGHDFDYLARALSQRYRVLCPDVAGRGRSDWLGQGKFYQLPQYVADIGGWLASLGVKRADWVGTSMGGMIGMAMAAINPGLIRKMVLNDVGAVVTARSLERIRSYVGKVMHFTNRAEAESALRTIFAPWGISDPEHWRHVLEHSLVEDSSGLRLAYDPKIAAPLDALEKIEDLDLWPLWEKIACPVLVIRGAQSDLLTHEVAIEMMARKANAKLVELPGIGHAPSLMDETQIRLIGDWLK